MQSIKLFIYKNSDQLEACELSVSSKSLEISSENVFVFSDYSSVEEIFPLRCDSDLIVLRTMPDIPPSRNFYVDTSNEQAIYFQKYSMKKDDDEWFLYEKSDKIGKINLFNNDLMHIPVSFAVKDKMLYILCITSEYIEDIKIVVFTYDLNVNLEKISDYSLFEDVWETYNISQIDCPAIYNVVATQTGFIYNEGQRIFEISYEDKSFIEVVNEATAEKYIPYFDSIRESYTFFNGCGNQNGIYVVSFSAFNEEPGMYLEFYNQNKKMICYIHITENSIDLYDEKSTCIYSLTGNFLPYAIICN